MSMTVLNKLKSILQNNVCNEITLREASDDNNFFKLVHPQCFIGWIPPKLNNASQLQLQASVPCLVIGIKEAEDMGESEEMEIELCFVVNSPGVKDDKGFLPNFDGYVDLLNFMDRTKAFLKRDSFSLDCMIINSQIKSGVYEEQPYPQWIGFMRFKIKYLALPSIDSAKYL